MLSQIKYPELDEKMIFYKNYLQNSMPIRLLGKGQSGEAWLMRHHGTGQNFIEKIGSISDKEIVNAVMVTTFLEHDNPDVSLTNEEDKVSNHVSRLLEFTTTAMLLMPAAEMDVNFVEASKERIRQHSRKSFFLAKGLKEVPEKLLNVKTNYILRYYCDQQSPDHNLLWGDFDSYLTNNTLDEKESAYFHAKLFRTLDYLNRDHFFKGQKVKFVHMDLKPNNVSVLKKSASSSPEPVIIDYGESIFAASAPCHYQFFDVFRWISTIFVYSNKQEALAQVVERETKTQQTLYNDFPDPENNYTQPATGQLFKEYLEGIKRPDVFSEVYKYTNAWNFFKRILLLYTNPRTYMIMPQYCDEVKHFIVLHKTNESNPIDKFSYQDLDDFFTEKYNSSSQKRRRR